MFRLFAQRGRGFVVAATQCALVMAAAIGWCSHAHATLVQSQVFPGWTPFVSGSDITLTSDTVSPHSGTKSLKFVNATSTSGDNGGFYQMIPVTPSTTYNFSVWVKGSGVTSSFLNNCIVMDQNVWTSQCVASGTFGWTHYTWSYGTLPGETSMVLSLYSTNTGTLWFDDFSVVASGSTTNLVTNPGFETAYDSVTILSPSQSVFPSGSWLGVTSTASTVSWTANDLNGVQVGSGSLSIPSGGSGATLVTPSVAPGWYSLHLSTASGGSVTSAFSVVTNSWQNNSATPNPFGVNMHPYTSEAQAVPAIGAVGLGSARFDLRWELTEKTAGVYTFSAADDQAISFLLGGGVKPLIVLGYSNPLYDGGAVPSTSAGLTAYANYASAVAAHYGNRVDYAVFNEYNVAGTNNSACGTTADCYYALLVPASNAIHTAASGARVVGPSLGGFTQDWLGTTPDSYQWLQRFITIGGLAYVDVVDIHNYTFPTVTPPEGNNNAVIAAVRSLLNGATGGASKPLWLTETGWPPYPGVATELQQAQYVVRDAALSLRAGIAQYMYYDLIDDCVDPTNGGCSFGMMYNPSATGGILAPKPGVTAYAVLARTLSGYTYASSDNWGTGVYALKFTNTAGANHRVVWSPGGNTTLAISTTSNVTVMNWDGSSSTLVPVGGIVTFSVGDDPVYVDGTGITAGAIAATPAFTATPPATVHHATSVPIGVTVNGTATGAPTGSITFRCAYGTTSVTASSGSIAHGTLTLSGFPNTGIATVPIEVVQGSNVVGRIVVTMTVTP